MKRICKILMFLIFLCGCDSNTDFDRAMQLRTSLLNANGCSFDITLTAAFAENTYTFEMACTADREGNIEFEVLKPESISGISGTISAEEGKLIFDDVALSFPLQTEEMISPICAPWVFIRAIRSGYVCYCVREEELLRLTVDDSYEDDALKLDIWVNSDESPVQADIFENNRRIFSLTIRNYHLL